VVGPVGEARAEAVAAVNRVAEDAHRVAVVETESLARDADGGRVDDGREFVQVVLGEEGRRE
jgi:hypothetical protein